MKMFVSSGHLIFNITLLIVIVGCLGSSLQRSCGLLLTQRLSLICDRRGPYSLFQKRAAADSRRQRRSIVEECCMNPCTDKDLFGYCQYDSTEEIYSEGITEKPVPVYDSSIGIIPDIKEHSDQKEKSFEGGTTSTDFLPIEVSTVSPEDTKSSLSTVFAD